MTKDAMDTNFTIKLKKPILEKIKQTALRNDISQRILIQMFFLMSEEKIDALISENRSLAENEHVAERRARTKERQTKRAKEKLILEKLKAATPEQLQKLLET